MLSLFLVFMYGDTVTRQRFLYTPSLLLAAGSALGRGARYIFFVSLWLAACIFQLWAKITIPGSHFMEST